MTKRLLALLVAVVLVAAACRDDGGDAGGDGADDGGEAPEGEGLSAEEQEYADAISVALRDDDDGFGADAGEAACMSEAMMAELGTEPFEEAGVSAADIEDDPESTPGELLGDGTISDAQADEIVDAWEGCADVNGLVAASAATEFELSAEEQTCFAEGLDESGVGRDLLTSLLTTSEEEPDDAAVTDMLGLLSDCGDDGGPVARMMADELMGQSNLDEEQAQCIAQALIDALGVEQLDAFSGGDFDSLDPEQQGAIGAAVLNAASACNVPISTLGGG